MSFTEKMSILKSEKGHLTFTLAQKRETTPKFSIISENPMKTSSPVCIFLNDQIKEDKQAWEQIPVSVGMFFTIFFIDLTLFFI